MRYSQTVPGSQFQDLAQDVIRLLIDDADKDGEPSLDRFRGFRDPNESRRDRGPGGYASAPFTGAH